MGLYLESLEIQFLILLRKDVPSTFLWYELGAPDVCIKHLFWIKIREKKNKITRYNNANRHLNGISACFRLPFFSDNAIIVVHFICKSWFFHCPWYTHTHTQNILLDDCRQVASWHIYYTQHRHILLRFSSALERHVKDSSRSG